MNSLSPQQLLQDLLVEFEASPPLDEAMICIAVDEDQEADRDAILRELDRIASGIHLPYPDSPFDVISRINTHLFDTLGFQGDYDDYHNPQNSLIHKVLESKKGLPIMLSALYIEIARRLDFEVLGIGFPYHFIVQPAHCEPVPFFIDPFYRGKILLEDDLRALLQSYNLRIPLQEAVAPTSTRQIIQRMSNNLFFSYQKRKDNDGVLRNLERLILISPECPDLFKIRSSLFASMGKIQQAIFSLKTYLECCQDSDDRSECEQRLKMLMKLSR